MPAVDNLIPRGIKAITPSDTVAQAGLIGIRCIADGTVKITDRLGNISSIVMTAGQEIICQVSLVWATGTTGTYLGYREA